eukprot:COSAG02_NODE_1132_length_14392_cov_7.068910_10_plen_94_part_00
MNTRTTDITVPMPSTLLFQKLLSLASILCTLCSWTILHKVLTRLNDFDGAVSTLREALRAEHITPDAAGSTITSSLRYVPLDKIVRNIAALEH